MGEVARCIENMRPVRVRNAVGSNVLPAVARALANARYTLDQRPEGGREFGIDETIHSQIFAELIDPQVPPGVLIVVSGDGNRRQASCTFPDLVAEAIRRGWAVEVYAWRRSMSQQYRSLQQQHSRTLVVRYLDDWAAEILAPNRRPAAAAATATAAAATAAPVAAPVPRAAAGPPVQRTAPAPPRQRAQAAAAPSATAARAPPRPRPFAQAVPAAQAPRQHALPTQAPAAAPARPQPQPQTYRVTAAALPRFVAPSRGVAGYALNTHLTAVNV